MMIKFGLEIEGTSPLSQDHILENLLSESIPAEIQGRGLSSTSSQDSWIITTDGSIQDLAEGKRKGDEIVSPIIQFNSDWRGLITKVCKALQASRLEVNKYCSLHVHVSIEGLSESYMRDIFELYKYIEPELNKMFPKSRRKNTHRDGLSYCKPIKDLSWQDFSNMGLQQADKSSATDTKYYSLRMCKYVPTYEFRIHQGTVNASKIIKWISIIDSIFSHVIILEGDYQDNYTPAEVLQIILKHKDLQEYYKTRVEKFRKD